jgi:hypothetical protein
MMESSSLRPQETASRNVGPPNRLLARGWETLSSREIALKFCVASLAAAALSRLGPIAALGGVFISLVVESAIERLVRRLRKRTLWSAGVLAILLDRVDRALAAIGLHARGRATAGATTAAGAIAAAFVVVAFTLPELALGHALVADRSLTFFDGRFDARHDGERRRLVVGPAATLTLPREVSAEATSADGARVAYDASTSAGRLTCTPASKALFPIGTTTVRCAARVGDRVSRGAFPVVVEDKSPPQLELPDDITWRTAKAEGAIVTFVATADDAVEGDAVAHCTPRSGSRFPVGRTTVECTAADGDANRAIDSFTVTVEHVEGAHLVLPAHMTIEATSAAGAVVPFTASAGGTGVSCVPRSASRLPIGDTVVSCRTRREADEFRVSVVDTTPPRFVVPQNLSAYATSRSGAEVTYAVEARDSVDGTIAPSCRPQTGSTFAIGHTLVRCSVRDAHGNARRASFGVAVLDGPPRLRLPAELSAAAVDARGARVPLGYTATDAVDGRIAASCSPAKPIFPIARTKVTCSAKDSAGNVVSGSLVVVVRDEAAPQLTLPTSPLAASATGPKGAAVAWRASAVDNVDGPVAVSCDRTSGEVFALGDTRVTCTGRDRADNVGKGSFTVSVRDRDPPVVTVPERVVTANADDARGAKVTFAAGAVDAVDGPVPVNCDPASGALFALGDTRVTCTARDSAGNVSKPAVFTVSVRDRTSPRLQLPASPLIASAVNASGAPVRFNATAVDDVDGSLDAQCDHNSGEIFALGRTRITCSATDAAGNRATDSFVVEVADRDGPTIKLPPSPVTATTTSKTGTKVKWPISAVDNVDGAVRVTCDHTNGGLFPIGETTVSCSASDSAGNTTRGSFIVKVIHVVPA